MNRGISPVIGVVVMVIVTILLASMFSFILPSLFDLERVGQTADDIITHRTNTIQTTGPDGAVGPVGGLVYTDEQGHLFSLSPSGHRIAYRPPTVDDSWNVEAIGPKSNDLDGDGLREIPYVNSANTLKLIDKNNETQVLAHDVRKNRVGVGTWGNEETSTETAVYYISNDGGELYRVSPGESPEPILEGGEDEDDSDSQFKSVAGVADIDNDDETEIVYVNNQEELAYVDDDETVEVGYGNIGKSTGYGIGQPDDLDGDGIVRAPIIQNDLTIAMVSAGGTATHFERIGVPAKAPVAIVEWTDGTERSIVYVGKDELLYYVTATGKWVKLTDANGKPITVDADQGVA